MPVSGRRYRGLQALRDQALAERDEARRERDDSRAAVKSLSARIDKLAAQLAGANRQLKTPRGSEAVAVENVRLRTELAAALRANNRLSDQLMDAMGYTDAGRKLLGTLAKVPVEEREVKP